MKRQGNLKIPIAPNSPLLTTNPSPKGKMQNVKKQEGQNPIFGTKRLVSPELSPSCEQSLTSFPSLSKKFSEEKTLSGKDNRDFEETLKKTRETYQGKVLYMQEYIAFLKQKLANAGVKGKELGEDEDLDEVEELKGEITHLHKVLKGKDVEIAGYLDELCEKQDRIYELTEKLNFFEKNMGNQRYNLEFDRERMIDCEEELKKQFRRQVNELEAVIRDCKFEIQMKNAEITSLQRVRGKVEREYIANTSLNGLVNAEIEEFVRKCTRQMQDIGDKAEKNENKVTSLQKAVRFLQTTGIRPGPNKLQALEIELTQKNEVLLKEKEKNLMETREILEKTQKENAEIKEFCKNLEENLKNKELSLENLQKTLENIKKEAESNETIAKTLKNSLKESENAVKEMGERQIEDLESIKALKEMLHDKYSEIAAKNEEIEGFLNQIEAEEKLKSEIVKKNISLEKKLSLFEELKGINSEKVRKINRLNENLEGIQEELLIAEARISDLQEELEKSSGLTTGQQLEILNLQGENGNLCLQLEEFSEKQKESNVLQENLKKEIHNLIKKLSEAGEQQIALQNSVKVHETLEQELQNSNHSLHEQLKNAKLSIISHEKQNSDLNETLISLQNSIESSKAKQIASDLEKEDFFQSTKKIQASKDAEIQICKKKIKELEDLQKKLLKEIDVNKENIKNLQGNLKEIKLKAVESETDLAKLNLALSEEIKTYKASEKGLKGEIKEILKQNSELKGILQKKDGEIMESGKENQDLRGKIKEFQEVSEEQEGIIKDFEEKNENLQGIVWRLENEIKKEAENYLRTGLNYEKRLNKQESAIVGMENERKALQEQSRLRLIEVERLEKMISQRKIEFSEEESKMGKEITGKDKRILELTELLQGKEQWIEELSKSYTDLQVIIKEKDGFIEDLNNKCEDFVELIEELKINELNLHETFENSKNSLEKHEKKIEKYQEKCKKLGESINDMKENMEINARNYEEEIGEKEKESAMQLKQIQEKNFKIEALEHDLNTVKIKSLEVETSLISSSLELKDALQKLKGKEIQLQKENSLISKSNSELKQELQKSAIKVASFSKENIFFREKIEENDLLHNAHLKHFEEIILLKEASESNQIRLIAELESLVESANSQKASLFEEKESKITQLLIEIDNYRRTIDNYMVASNENSMKIQRLERQISEQKCEFIEKTNFLNEKLGHSNSEFIAICKTKSSGDAINKKLIEVQEDLRKKLCLSSENEEKLEKIIRNLEKEKEKLEDFVRELELILTKKEAELDQEDLLVKQLQSEIAGLNEGISQQRQIFFKLKQENTLAVRQEKELTNQKIIECADYKFQVDKLLIELNSVKLKALESDTNATKSQLDLNEEIVSFQINEKNYQKELENLTIHCNTLKENLSEITEKTSELTCENRTFQAKIQKSKEKKADLKEKEIFLHNNLEETREKYLDLQNSYQELKQNHMHSELVISDLKYQILVHEKDLFEEKKIEENMGDIIEQDYKKMIEQESKISGLSEEVLKLNEILNSFQRDFEEEKEKYEKDLEVQQRELKKMRKDLKVFRKQAGWLLKELGKTEEIVKSESFDLAKEMTGVRELFENLKMEKLEISQWNKEIQSQNAILTHKIQSHIEEKNAFKQTTSQETSEKTLILQQYLSKIRELEHINKILTKKAENSKAKSKSLKSQISALESSNQASLQTIETLKTSETAQKSLIANLEQEISDIEEIKASIEFEFSRVVKEFDKLAEKHKILEKSLAESTKTIEKLQKVIEETEGFEVHDLQNKLVQTETKLVLLEYQREKDQIELQKLQENSQQRINLYKIDVLAKDLEDKKTLIETMINENEKCRIEIKRLKSKAEIVQALFDQLDVKENILSTLAGVNINTSEGRNKAQEVITKAAYHLEKVQVLKSSLKN